MVDLGEFKLTNSFVTGGEVMAEQELHPLSTNSDAKAILDKMVVESSAIEVCTPACMCPVCVSKVIMYTLYIHVHVAR